MHARRYLAMAAILGMVTCAASAQRHSGDTGQGYFKRAPNPILNIEDRAEHRWIYLRLSELKQKKAQAVLAVDGGTGRPATFVGVPLKELIDGDGQSIDIFQSGRFFRDKLAFTSAALDPGTNFLVAYSENGRALGEHPFWIIAVSKEGNRVALRDLAYLRIDKVP